MTTSYEAECAAFYAQPGPMTEIGECRHILGGLPDDIRELCRVVQGLIVHVFWAERYGLHLAPERQQEVQIRPLADMLARALELDASPLTVARPPERRLVGNCRDFTVLLCGLLRHQGVPARARCGFGTYFVPGRYEDHWVCEYWRADEKRWVMVDAQLDSLQREVLGIDFDLCDMPPGRFLLGGEAWQLCRAGRADPDHFGIFDMHGLWFIRGDLVRDFLALNRIEILPWDSWELMAGPDEPLTPEDGALLDHLAALTLGGDEAFAQVRELFERDPRLQTRPEWW